MNAQGYDGSIRISTKIDSKGFVDGMKVLDKSATNAFSRIMKVFAGTGSMITKLKEGAVIAFGSMGKWGSMILPMLKEIILNMSLVAIGIGLIVTGLIKMGTAAVKAGIRLVNSMGQAVDKSSSFGKLILSIQESLEDIKGAFYAAFYPVLNALVPHIKSVSDFLVRILNTIAMVIAKMLGQKTVMQYIAGSAKEADKLAKNTRKAGEAAEGALAAFDQLNVLQTEKGAEDDPAAGKMKFVEVAVDDAYIQGTWDMIKGKAEEVLNWLREKWIALWVRITDGAAATLNGIKDVLLAIWDRAKQGWSALWNGLRDVALAIWDRIKQGASAAWEGIKSVFRALGEWFRSNVWNPIREKFTEVWSRVKELASAAWGDVKRLWGMAKDWFRVNVTDPIKNAFSSALNAIGGFFKSKFEAIKEVIVKVLNFVIDKINGLINRIVSGLNVVIGLLNKLSIPLPGFLGGGSIGFNIPKLSAPQIPRLATGAVIPPNSEFLAVMGDQKRGKNLEAPEELIRQIVREETSNTAGQEVTINFAGNMGSLIRAMKPYIDRENARVGKSLVRGIA